MLELTITLLISFIIILALVVSDRQILVISLVILFIVSLLQFGPKITEVYVDGCTYWVKSADRKSEKPKSVKVFCDNEKSE